MAHKTIEPPGMKSAPNESAWKYAFFDSIQIKGRQDEPIAITIMFRIHNYRPLDEEDEEDSAPSYIKLSFPQVFEYRFIAEDFSYEDISAHEHDWEAGLIEITPSEYIENMAAKGRLRWYPGERFGSLPESEVRHFRIALHEWGKLDVIAMDYSFMTASSG